MCRVCFVETGTDQDVCDAHDGKRPSSVIVWLLGHRECVIEATGGSDAIVRYLDTGARGTVRRRDLRRAA